MKILLGVTGSVATVLTTKLAAHLKELGEVKIIATENALKIDSSFLESNEVYRDQDEWKWSKVGDQITHINLRNWYDVFVIAPLSANTLAKMSYGICDNLLTTTWMASNNKNIVVAPAMNTRMWKHPIVQYNITVLRNLNVKIIPPIAKTLACGDVGIGAMADISDIVNEVKKCGG